MMPINVLNRENLRLRDLFLIVLGISSSLTVLAQSPTLNSSNNNSTYSNCASGPVRNLSPISPSLKEIEKLKGKVEEIAFPDTANFKTESELKRYICIFREPPKRTTEGEFKFKEKLSKFIEASQFAEKDFGVSKELLLCTVLAESSFNSEKISSQGAYGYGQFTIETINTVSKLRNLKNPKESQIHYRKNWETYSSRFNPSDSPLLTEEKIIKQSHIPSTIGAMALKLKFNFDQFISPKLDSTCKENCSSQLKKDKNHHLLLLAASYNYGPGIISKIHHLEPEDLFRDQKLPSETRQHLKKIHRCLEKEKSFQFRETDKEQDRFELARVTQIRSLEKRIARVENDLVKFDQKGSNPQSNANIEKLKKELLDLKKLHNELNIEIPVNVSPEYESNYKLCNFLYPTK